MSISELILLNIGVATILVAILAAVMLLPTRLHRHFAAGHTPRQKHALRRQLHAASAKREPHRAAQRGLRPIPD